MDATTASLIVVGLLISTAVAMWVIWAYLEGSKPKRIRRARREQELSKSDEAHNLVVATRSIINVMKSKGIDVSDAEILINRAELSLDAGDKNKAKGLAEEAREELDSAKSRPVAPVRLKKKEVNPIEVAVDQKIQKGLLDGRERVNRLPDNFLESKFEIDVAKGLFDKKGTPEAERLLGMAQLCYDDEDYTTALKYAIRCKKAIDEGEAGLLAAQKIGHRKEDSQVEDVREIRIKETTMEGELKCPECGNTVGVDDKFCNLCGEKLSFQIYCPSCGVEVSPTQKFCAECGEELAASVYECPECGAEIDEDSRFCPGCGIEFSE